jgi:hypothetical protein
LQTGLTNVTFSKWYLEQMGDTKVFQLSAGAIDADPVVTIEQGGKLFADVSGCKGANFTLTECGENCDEGVFM